VGRIGTQDTEDSVIFTWTVDVEKDWGGRINTFDGIKYGIPVILDLFRDRGIRALFFISTEVLEHTSNLVETIADAGHAIGSHGHFHTKYSDKRLSELDKLVSLNYLGDVSHYRSPWFHYKTDDIYSNKKNHVSVLKHSWIKQSIPNRPIFYIHPFDIVGGNNAPNLFCKLLYSRPDNVLNTFCMLTRYYRE
jgi:peptidoglycan/xylan/chitin deacetylase (PgdA/CDA1 family)